MKIGNYDLGQIIDVGFTTENSHHFTGPFGAVYEGGAGLPAHLMFDLEYDANEDDFYTRDYPQYNAPSFVEIDYAHNFRLKTNHWDVNHQWLSPGTAVGVGNVLEAQNAPFSTTINYAYNSYMNWTDNSGNISSYESVRNAYYPFNTTRFNTLYASSLFTELIHHNLTTANNEAIPYGLDHIAHLTKTMFAGMHGSIGTTPWNNLKHNYRMVEAGLPYVKFRIQSGVKHQGNSIATLSAGDGSETPEGYIDYYVIMRLRRHEFLGGTNPGPGVDLDVMVNESGLSPTEFQWAPGQNFFNILFNVDNYDINGNTFSNQPLATWLQELQINEYIVPTIVAKWTGVGDTPLYSSPLSAVLNTPPAGETNRVNFSDSFPLPGDHNPDGDPNMAPVQGWHPMPLCEFPPGYDEEQISILYQNRRGYNCFWKYGCGVHPLHFTVDKLFLQDWDIGGRIPPDFNTQQVWDSIINGTLIQQMMMDWSAFYTVCNRTLNWQNIPDETRQLIEGFFQRVMSIYILWNNEPNWSHIDIAEYGFDTSTEWAGFYPDTDSTNGDWDTSQLGGVQGKINLMRAFGPLAPQGYTPRMGTNYASYFEGVEFEFNENDFDPSLVSHTEFIFNGGLNLGTMESIDSHFGYDANTLLTDVETLAQELYGNINLALYNLFDRELYKLFYEGQQLIVRLEQNAWDNQLIPLETQTTTDTTYQMVGVTSLSGNRGNSGMADNLTDILGLDTADKTELRYHSDEDGEMGGTSPTYASWFNVFQDYDDIPTGYPHHWATPPGSGLRDGEANNYVLRIGPDPVTGNMEDIRIVDSYMSFVYDGPNDPIVGQHGNAEHYQQTFILERGFNGTLPQAWWNDMNPSDSDSGGSGGDGTQPGDFSLPGTSDPIDYTGVPVEIYEPIYTEETTTTGGGVDYEFLGQVYNAPMGTIVPFSTPQDALVYRTPMDYQLSWVQQSNLLTPEELSKFQYLRQVNQGLRNWTYNYDAPSYNSYYKKLIRFFHNVTAGLPTAVQNEYPTHTLNPFDSTSWSSFVNDWGTHHQDDIRNYLHQLSTEFGGIDDWELVDWFNWVKTGCINTYSSTPPFIDGDSIFGTFTGDVVNDLGDFQPTLTQTLTQAENQEYILVNYKGPQIANMWWAVCDYLNQFPELISGQIEWIASTQAQGGVPGDDPQSLGNAILYTSIPFTDIMGNTVEKGFYPADAESPYPSYFFNPQPATANDDLPDLAIKMIPNTTLTTTAFGGFVGGMTNQENGFPYNTNFLAMVQQMLLEGINGSTIDCYPEEGALYGDGGDGVFSIEDGELYLQRHGDIRPLQLIQYAQQNNIMPLLYQFLPIDAQMQATGADITNQDFLQSPLLLENSPNSIGVFDNVNNAVKVFADDSPNPHLWTSQAGGEGYFSTGVGPNGMNPPDEGLGLTFADFGASIESDGYFKRDDHELLGADVFTSSINPSNHPYYYTISKGDPSLPSSRDVFDISWGHINGSGSLAKNNGPSPSEAIYRQAANELLGTESGSFTSVSQSVWHEIGAPAAELFPDINQSQTDDYSVENNPKPDEYIYIIRTKRFNNEADMFDEGVIFNFRGKNASGANKLIQLSVPTWSTTHASAKYNTQPNGLIRYYLAAYNDPRDGSVMGSTERRNSLFNHGCFGYWYPQTGVAIINSKVAELLDAGGNDDICIFGDSGVVPFRNLGLNPHGLTKSDKDYKNALKLANTMRDAQNQSPYYTVRNLRWLHGPHRSSIYNTTNLLPSDASDAFHKTNIVAKIKLKQNEFNFTTNPTRFVDVDAGGDYNNFTAIGTHPATAAGLQTMKFDSSLGTSPTTYITHVTLYDSSGYEIAVAKLSKPIKKDFNSEVVIKIVLNIE